MTDEIATVIELLLEALQSIRDLALIAPTVEQREAFLWTADLVEECIRDFDRRV